MVGRLGSAAPPHTANSRLRQTAHGPCTVVPSPCLLSLPHPAGASRRLPRARSPGRRRAPARAAVGAHKGPAGELASGSIATFRSGQVSLRPGRCFPGSPAPGATPGVEGHGRLRRGFPSAARRPWTSDPERPRSSLRDPAGAGSRRQPPASAQLPSGL